MHSNSRHKTRSAPLGEVEHGVALCRTRNRRGFCFASDTGPHKAKAHGAQARLIGEFEARARVANFFMQRINRG